MKENRQLIKKILFIGLFFCLYSFLQASETAKNETVRVGWYESYCFQEGMSDSTEKSGYSYEYLARIADYTGWKYEYVYGEWSELLEKLQNGQIDILAGVSITDERRKSILFPNYIMGTDNYYLYQHADNQLFNTENLESFNGKKIGCIRNNRMTNFLIDWLKNNNVDSEIIYYDGFTERDTDFSNYKIDAITANDKNIRSDSALAQVIKIGEDPFYLGVSKDREDIVKELNSVLGNILNLSPNFIDMLQSKSYGNAIPSSALRKDEKEWLEKHKDVYLGYLNNYMPFSERNKNGQVTGVITDIADNIISKLDTSNRPHINYIGYDSFSEMYDAIRKNQIDFGFPIVSERPYLEEMDIAGTFDIMTVPFVIAYKGALTENTFDVIAVNTKPIKAITDHYSDSEFLRLGNSAQCLDAVKSGKATCAIMSSYRMRDLLNNHKYREIKTIPFSENMNFCIGVNKSSYTLLSLLNKGISQLDKNNIIDDCYNYLQQNLKYTAADFIKDHLSAVILFIMIFFILIIVSFVIYLSVIRKSRKNLQINLEKVNILAALSKDYEAIHVADLDLKTFSTMRLSNGMKNFGYEVATLPYASAVVSLINQFVLPEQREDFLKFLSIDSLKHFMEENHSFSYRYGIVKDDTGNYIYEMTFVRVSDEPNRHLLVIGTKCIDSVLKFERVQGQYNEALLSDCTYFYDFDVTDGRIDGKFVSKKNYNPLMDLKLNFPMSYDDFNEARMRNLGLKAETPQEEILWTCDGLKKSYKEGRRTVSIRYDSEQLGMSWNATIILSEDDISHHLHAVYICKDVTDLVKAEQNKKIELEKALVAAEQANRAKTMFLNNMSHDIRTPMNAILGFADLMEKEKNDPNAVSGYLKKIKSSGEYLLTIINDVLDMARIESGKTSIEESFMDVEEAANFMISNFESLMKEKNQKFVVTSSIQHKYLMLDCAKHEQITMNLLSNAVKYTKKDGEIHMNLEELPCDEKGFGIYKMTVSDNGIGMHPDFVEHIFDSFSRERNTTESKIIGTGLGMSIVKKLVDLMGGTIEVKSELGKGSSFIVTFKQKIVENPEKYLNKNEEDEKKENCLEGKRILLVEDNEFNAEIATSILEDFGLKIEHACDGVQCLEMLKKSEENYYDLILMDIQMPNMDGYEASKNIRAMEDSYRKNIPIIAMTANAFEEDKQKAFAAGMNSHLAKPIRSNEVKKELEKFLG